MSFNSIRQGASMRPLLHIFIALLWACASISAAVAQEPAAATARKVLRVVYFTPTDREPLPDRVERLDRTLTEVQRFYRDGMQQHGHGPLTFELDRDADGKLRMFEVRAKGPMRDYGRDGAGKVRDEVKAALEGQARPGPRDGHHFPAAARLAGGEGDRDWAVCRRRRCPRRHRVGL